MLKNNQGFCLDPFNEYLIQAYLKEQLKNFDVSTYGFWLDNNIPKADLINSEINKDDIEENFLFVPEGVDTELNTIPKSSYHRN